MKPVLKQQLHKRCGGEIVVMADKDRELRFACTACSSIWEINDHSQKVPNDFKSIKGGIIINK